MDLFVKFNDLMLHESLKLFELMYTKPFFVLQYLHRVKNTYLIYFDASFYLDFSTLNKLIILLQIVTEQLSTNFDMLGEASFCLGRRALQ